MQSLSFFDRRNPTGFWSKRFQQQLRHDLSWSACVGVLMALGMAAGWNLALDMGLPQETIVRNAN